MALATDRELIGSMLELLHALSFKLTGEEPRVPVRYDDGSVHYDQGTERIKWHKPTAVAAVVSNRDACPHCGALHTNSLPFQGHRDIQEQPV